MTNYRKLADRKMEELRSARRAVKAEKAVLSQAQRDVEDAAEAQVFLQRVAQEVQRSAHKQISAVVTRCLRAVGYDYKFRIVFERKRGKTDARLVFVKDGLQHSPLKSSGGGAVDVGAFALRLACLLFSRPRLRRLMVLDEPFKHVDAGRRVRLRVLLETLAKELGVQFIMVTHDPELETGTIIRLAKKPGGAGILGRRLAPAEGSATKKLNSPGDQSRGEPAPAPPGLPN